MGRDRPRVLLLWPGGLFSGGANFGVPQLLMIAAALERRADAIVDVVDLDMERGLGGLDLRALCARGYDLVGISCYSSFDYLKVMALAALVRERLPKAWLVTGGYHPSARPDDFTGTESPFDYVVVGDGERPMVRLAEALVSGKRPLMRVLGPESTPDPAEFLPYRWELLERYRPVARRVASQAEIYLSRGCPYDCAFCMERAKRDTSWRALPADFAVEEMHRLDRFLDLSGWTLFVADALFGMKRSWRRAFLEELARRPVRAARVWLLIRVDLVEREDLELMARAGVSPGFGLESGDPEQLRRIRKTGKLDGYLEKMITVSEWARELDVPFGANIIVGHPGETEKSLRTSAAYMRRVFLDGRGTHGFLSVDPFRLYPGSPIDEERAAWEADTGMRVHRYPWWHDGDQEFLAQWVDPSSELDFRRALSLKRELFDPIVSELPRRFSHQGPARDYFLRAFIEQQELARPARTLHTLGLFHLWRSLSESTTAEAASRALSADAELCDVARDARRETLARNEALGASGDAVIDALLRVPRERFVRLEDVTHSARDVPLPLAGDGQSTISALHAYAAACRTLDIRRGDAVADLGGGTGYGAAVFAEMVGSEGSVVTVEADASLAELARQNLAEYENVRPCCGNAHDTKLWAGASKVFCAFAVEKMPSSWLAAIPDGGRVVAPVGTATDQRLMRFERAGDRIIETDCGPVRYVLDRGAALTPPARPAARPEIDSLATTPTRA